MRIRDRIIDFRRVAASTILPNPKNWRTHPQAQADALRGVLAEIGFADAVLARETPDGLMLIDGHLRCEVTPDQEIPVLVLDVTEDEADKILATHDPLTLMAEADVEKLEALFADIETQSEALRKMLDELVEDEQRQLVLDRLPAGTVDNPPFPPALRVVTDGNHALPKALVGPVRDRACASSSPLCHVAIPVVL